MFGEIVYTVIEEIKFGNPKSPGTWIRLEESPRGKRVIRLWSGAGKNKYWKVMYRYDVEANWKGWKRLKNANILSKKSKK
jgi:hypothetical protein